MIAVDTNVLVGAIQTFDPQLRATGFAKAKPGDRGYLRWDRLA